MLQWRPRDEDGTNNGTCGCACNLARLRLKSARPQQCVADS